MRDKPRIIALVGATIATLLCACGGSERSDGRTEASDGELDRLRALPYVGSTPIDRGEPGGVVHRDPDRSQAGPTLYTIQMLSRADLIDESGRILRSWSDPESGRWEHVELLTGTGDLLVIGADPSPPGVEGIADDNRYLARFDWNGNMLWKRAMPVHHDIERAPDGRLVLLAFRRRRIPEVHPDIDVRDDLLVMIDEQGEVLEHLSLLEAFLRGREIAPLHLVAPNKLGVVPWLDVFHTNSVEWMRRPELAERDAMFDPANVLISLRHQNLIAVVNWPGRAVVWAWGQDELLGPHDARVLDNGNVLVFDNGMGRGFSRVLEVDPVERKIVWEYRADPPESFYTVSKGSSQRLANGNTLIADSDNGRAFEVTPPGEIVWEFYCPYEVLPGERAAIVRAIRFEPHLIESIEDIAARR